VDVHAMTVAKWVQYAAGGFAVLILLSFATGKPEVLPQSTVQGFVEDDVYGPFSAIRADGSLVRFDDRDFGDPGPEILSHRCISTTDRRGGVRKSIPRNFACYAQLNYEGEALLMVFGAQRSFDLEGRETIARTSLHEWVMNDYRVRFDFPQPGAAVQEE
jgi:hypothetical protein